MEIFISRRSGTKGEKNAKEQSDKRLRQKFQNSGVRQGGLRHHRAEISPVIEPTSSNTRSRKKKGVLPFSKEKTKKKNFKRQGKNLISLLYSLIGRISAARYPSTSFERKRPRGGGGKELSLLFPIRKKMGKSHRQKT